MEEVFNQPQLDQFKSNLLKPNSSISSIGSQVTLMVILNDYINH